jgi:acetyl esterase/lipase
MSKWALTVVVALVSQTQAAAQPPAPKRPNRASVPDNVRALRDLPYVRDGHERQKLDLYLPKDAGGPLPLVIWIHGGGWQNGSKDGCPALPLTQRGFAVASLNYRLSGHAVFPAQIEDCKAAVRWLRANAKEHGLDHDRFGVWGSSAGGHLVALLGTSGDVKEWETVGEHRDVSSRVQAVCDWYGPTDLLQMDRQAKESGGRAFHDAANSPESKLIGGPIQERREQAAKANPIVYVTRDDPPFLIAHGDADPAVPVGQSRLLEATLKAAGVDVTLYIVAGGGHGGWSDPKPRELVEQFFVKVLKAEPFKP